MGTNHSLTASQSHVYNCKLQTARASPLHDHIHTSYFARFKLQCRVNSAYSNGSYIKGIFKTQHTHSYVLHFPMFKIEQLNSE